MQITGIKKIISVICGELLPLFTPKDGLSDINRKPVMIEGKRSLYLRVLSRPFSHVYKSKNEKKGKVMENVPAFKHFYVYTQPAAHEPGRKSGWYEVGIDKNGTVIGWMKEDDVFEWKHTMCLSFTHPAGRKPVRLLKIKGQDNQNNLSNPLHEVVNTVDSFQGQERDLIIHTFTRSNSFGYIGFLSDYRRLNVAMTRTRKQLVMIGDFSTLNCKDKKASSTKSVKFKEIMEQLQSYLKKHGEIIDARDWMHDEL